MKVEWISTDLNVADFFTKKLAREKFEKFRNILMGDEKLQGYFSPIVARTSRLHNFFREVDCVFSCRVGRQRETANRFMMVPEGPPGRKKVATKAVQPLEKESSRKIAKTVVSLVLDNLEGEQPHVGATTCQEGGKDPERAQECPRPRRVMVHPQGCTMPPRGGDPDHVDNHEQKLDRDENPSTVHGIDAAGGIWQNGNDLNAIRVVVEVVVVVAVAAVTPPLSEKC